MRKRFPSLESEALMNSTQESYRYNKDSINNEEVHFQAPEGKRSLMHGTPEHFSI